MDPVINLKIPQRLYGTMILIIYKMGEIVVVVLHNIYWALAILLLFYSHQDTEYDSSKMEIGVSRPTAKQKKHQRL